MKHLRSLSACLALTAFGLGAPMAQEPIKIGFMAEFSGPQAGLGQDMLDGFMLGLEKINHQFSGTPVQVIREDSQLKPDVAVQVARRLIEREKVDIIAGMTFSNIMMAVHPIVTRSKTILLGTNAGPSPIAGKACSPYQFIVSRQGDQQSEVLGKYATEQGYKNVVLMAPNYQAGKDVITGFKRFYQGRVVEEINTPIDQFDFSVELTKVASMKPDAVFAFYPGSPGINFLRQFRQLGLMDTTPLLTVAVVDGISLPALQASARNVLLGSTWGPDLDNAVNQEFVNRFQAKYKRIPSEYAASSYDAVLLLDQAFKQTQGKADDKEKLISIMRQLTIDSVRGPLKFGNNHFPIQDMRVFKAVADGQDTVLKTIATPLPQTQDAYHADCKMKF